MSCHAVSDKSPLGKLSEKLAFAHFAGKASRVLHLLLLGGEQETLHALGVECVVLVIVV